MAIIHVSCILNYPFFLYIHQGCCSLCARVCHKGHDVGYSRKSSFFCDCGAEVATAIAEGRTPCKCLTPVAEDVIREVFGENNNNNVELVTQETHQNYPECVFTDLLAKNCKVDCQASLKSLVNEASKKEWKESILTFFNECYQTTTPNTTIDYSKLFAASASEATIETGIDLEPRSGTPLAIKRLNQTSMFAIRAARSSALQSRMVTTPGGSSRTNCQCTSSCCVAFLLDSDGSIFGSFELLPNVVSADTIGGVYGIQGPFTHFQELGTVKRGTESLYKVSCVGKSTRSNQPRSIVLEFNEKSVSVKELQWPASSSLDLVSFQVTISLDHVHFRVHILLAVKPQKVVSLTRQR